MKANNVMLTILVGVLAAFFGWFIVISGTRTTVSAAPSQAAPSFTSCLRSAHDVANQVGGDPSGWSNHPEGWVYSGSIQWLGANGGKLTLGVKQSDGSFKPTDLFDGQYYQAANATFQCMSTNIKGWFFAQTRARIQGPFWSYWSRFGFNDGVAIFGYPMADEAQENGRTVQYFERNRFELHTENQPPYNILLTRYGANDYLAKHPPAGQYTQPQQTNQAGSCPNFAGQATSPTADGGCVFHNSQMCGESRCTTTGNVPDGWWAWFGNPPHRVDSGSITTSDATFYKK